MSLRKSIIAGAAAGAVTFAGLVAVPAVAQSTEPGGPSVVEQVTHPWAQWHHHRRQERVEQFATELGVSVDELRSAAQAAHQSVVDQFGKIDRDNPPDDATIDARRDAFRTALAENLGVTVEDLHDAALAVFESYWQ